MKDVLLLVGAGQIGMAITRRIGFDKKIIIGDKNLVNAKKIADIMYNAGFDVNYLEVDLADGNEYYLNLYVSPSTLSSS